METTEHDDRAAPGEGRSGRRSARRWAVIVLLVVAAGLLAWVFATAVLPRWWAQRVGGVIDGRLTVGTLAGVVVGAVFTVAPLIVVALAWRFRSGWRRALVSVVVAVAIALPNLATLGIVHGTGNAAHAGERILDVDGPGFRGGTLVGAVIGAVLVVGVAMLASSRRRNRAKVADLESRLDRRGD